MYPKVHCATHAPSSHGSRALLVTLPWTRQVQHLISEQNVDDGTIDDMATRAAEASLGFLKIPPPKHFTGRQKEDDSSEFETFSRQLKAYLSIQSRRMKELMVSAEQTCEPVGMPVAAEDQALAIQLQNFLILTCQDKAARIVCRDESDENGFESWRRLHARYALCPRVKYLGHMQKILTWKFTEANLEQDLNDWESEIEKYERGAHQSISEDVRVGVLMSNAPSDIQKHLQLTTGLDSTYAQVRGVILNW